MTPMCFFFAFSDHPGGIFHEFQRADWCICSNMAGRISCSVCGWLSSRVCVAVSCVGRLSPLGPQRSCRQGSGIQIAPVRMPGVSSGASPRRLCATPVKLAVLPRAEQFGDPGAPPTCLQRCSRQVVRPMRDRVLRRSRAVGVAVLASAPAPAGGRVAVWLPVPFRRVLPAVRTGRMLVVCGLDHPCVQMAWGLSVRGWEAPGADPRCVR